MASRILTGVLEIDHDRGVIYFHVTDPEMVAEYGTVTVLRICKLPKPIPEGYAIDITHMVGASITKG